jgi:hypothetical protein
MPASDGNENYTDPKRRTIDVEICLDTRLVAYGRALEDICTKRAIRLSHLRSSAMGKV